MAQTDEHMAMQEGIRRPVRRLSPSEEIDLKEELREMEQEEELIRQETELRRERRRKRREQEEKDENRMKHLILTGILVLTAVILTAFFIVYAGSLRRSGRQTDGPEQKQISSVSGQDASKKVAGTAKITEEKEDTVSLAAVGDNLISQRMLDQALARGNGSYDFAYVYADMKNFLAAHDMNWIDVETDINDRIEPAGYPTFSTPAENGYALADAGFNIYSLSNNHTNDLGLEGIKATLAFWNAFTAERKDMLVAGLWKTEDGNGELSGLTASYTQENLHEQPDVYAWDIPVFTCKNGRKVAYLSYAEMSNMDEAGDIYGTPEGSPARLIYTYEKGLIKAQIEKAGAVADAVVVACHWGEEDSHEIGEAQKELAQNLADWGADLIIGDHPHVVQDAAWISAADGRKVFCAYSLGNFVSTQEQPDELIGVALDCRLSFTGSGENTAVEVKDPKLVPIVTHYGKDGAEAKVCLLSDYTDQQAEKNGINDLLEQNGSQIRFRMDYIKNVLKQNISSEFLG